MSNLAEELLFVPLGGIGEFGKNLALYGLGTAERRRWVLIDLGVSFADDELPGIDLVFPDITFLLQERKNLVGIVLTHAHEDHFGALPELWAELRVPVYASPFAAAVIASKGEGRTAGDPIPVTIVQLGERVSVGPFDIEFVPVDHSIPEANALFIRTSLGNVFHTGDWRLDLASSSAKRAQDEKLSAIGREGVLVVVGDSTNAIRDGYSPAEEDVKKTLSELISTTKRRVGVATFASNITRIRSCIDAAQQTNREVVIVGRSLERFVNVAQELGHIDKSYKFHEAAAFRYLPPHRVLALCTGSQGEPRAALARIARDEHPDATFSPGDRIILSSRAIPGNERVVTQLVNRLIEKGLDVITDRTHLIHVSGHPRKNEIVQMYEWLKPQYVIPVHGEAPHLHDHAKLANRLGLRPVLCKNGDIVRLAPSPVDVLSRVHCGAMYKDGGLLISSASGAIEERRRIGQVGLILIAIALSRVGKMKCDPQIEIVGVPETDMRGNLIANIVSTTISTCLHDLPNRGSVSSTETADIISSQVHAAVAEVWGKEPMCSVRVLIVD